jgi:flavin reductase (DIM6/NTAB) family NADH-FMN oxidoreductase RutF
MKVSEQELKNVMARVAATVTVVTVNGEEGPTGVTVSSFTSVSLDPPIVLVCMKKDQAPQQAVIDAPGFTVNVMGRGTEDASMRFAMPDVDRFAGCEWKPAGLPDAGPVLTSAIAHLECRTMERSEVGDHWVLYGEVHGAVALDEETPPLVWLGRGFVDIVT